MTFRFISWIVCAQLLIWNVAAVPLSNVTISKHPVILIVSYDGFRSDYLPRVNTTTLDALRRNGVTVPYMEPTFPTKTFPNHQSIATGVYSETHGIVDNTFFDPKYNETLSGFNDDPGFWNYHPEVVPIWIANERAGDGRISGCLMWPGSSQPYGKDNSSLPTYYHPGYDGSVLWENRVETVISWITNDTKPANLVFLYYDEPDSQGHVFGPNYDETLKEVAQADNRTTYLVNKLKEAGIFDKINLIVLSDHGMKEVTQQRIIYLNSYIDDLVERRHGGTPLLHLIPKEGKEDELFETLTNQSAMHNLTYSVWKKDNLPTSLYYTKSRRVLDYVVLAEPGYAFDDFNTTIQRYNDRQNWTANETRQYGVHGYTNEAASMRPLFIGHGPAFVKGREFSPIKNVDIVPLISKLLNISDVSSNGSLSRVIDMIDPNFLGNSASSKFLSEPSGQVRHALNKLLATSFAVLYITVKWTITF